MDVVFYHKFFKCQEIFLEFFNHKILKKSRKKFNKIFQKPLDKIGVLWYNLTKNGYLFYGILYYRKYPFFGTDYFP